MMRTIQSQVGTVILSLEAGRLYAEWMAGGGVELPGRRPSLLRSGSSRRAFAQL